MEFMSFKLMFPNWISAEFAAADVDAVVLDHLWGHVLLVVGEAGIEATAVTEATGWILGCF